MTETLVKKILEAVQKADNYEPITIHHYGNDYIVIFRQESDGVKLLFTGHIEVYRYCATDIRNTYIDSIFIQDI